MALVLWLPATTAWADEPAMPGQAISGFWQTEQGEAVVEIRADPDTQTYSGRLVWLRQARYLQDDPRGIGGQRVVDRHNPDPDRRTRPLLGLTLLTGLAYHPQARDGRGQWQSGRIYDTENGKHYDCYVWLADAEHLKLHGYVGVRLLGRTTTWTRVADPARVEPEEMES
ncbi:hypothetical protein T31B1_04835 [Salinisphaera sp. T31B1]